MAAPNIITSTSLIGRTNVLAVTTSPLPIISNTVAGGTGILYKATTLYVCNVSGASATVTVELSRPSNAGVFNSVTSRLAFNVIVPVGGTVAIIEKGDTINIEEGDDLRLTASTAGALEATCAYDQIA